MMMKIMSKSLGICRAASGFVFCLSTAFVVSAADWPQYQCTPQRHGYSPDRIEPPYKIAWARNFLPDRLYPATQPVVVEGRLFIGTKGGVFYALDAETGREIWSVRLDGGIFHTAGVENGKVFVGCGDGNVYAFSALDGAQLWRYNSIADGERPVGFSAAVLLAEGNVFIPRRDGAVFALSQADGKLVWRRDFGIYIRQGMAYDEGRVFLGTEDMRMHAMSAKDGAELWTAPQVFGLSWGDFCPVVAGGLVMSRVMNFYSGASASPFNDWKYTEVSKPEIRNQRAEWAQMLADGELPKEFDAAQDVTLQSYRDNPHRISLHVYDAATGEVPFIFTHWRTIMMGGALSPPAVFPDGTIHVSVPFCNSGWGRASLKTGRLVDLFENLLSAGDLAKNPGRLNDGRGNGDETMNCSIGGDIFYAIHIMECNAQYTGVYDMRSRRWTQIQPLGGEQSVMDANGSGGGSPVSISGRFFYHLTYERLIARTSADGN